MIPVLNTAMCLISCFVRVSARGGWVAPWISTTQCAHMDAYTHARVGLCVLLGNTCVSCQCDLRITSVWCVPQAGSFRLKICLLYHSTGTVLSIPLFLYAGLFHCGPVFPISLSPSTPKTTQFFRLHLRYLLTENYILNLFLSNTLSRV